jgi:hypothetical protein
MERPYSFRDFMKDCPAGKFLDDLTLTVVEFLALLGWLGCLPFAPLVFVIRRRVRGKSMAAAWKRMHGYKCPDSFIWWMKYM